MTRTGRPPDSGVSRDERVFIRVNSAEHWWWKHVAAHAELSLAELIRMLMDRAIGEHTCQECEQKGERK